MMPLDASSPGLAWLNPMQENTTTTESTSAAPRTDRLELVKELSRGSIGTVHKARNPQAERSTALRQFQVPEWLDDVNELLQRILAEARAASALDHPNIARLHTCGYKEFSVFMTAEFVDGRTLKEIMAVRTPDLNEILVWAKQLCAAIDYANDKGVYHHFLNPYNIKITTDGSLKMLDFGLVRDKNLMSPTPAKKLEDAPYLSPEQVKNKIADRAANMFNLGVILYELYTTRSPFAGKHLGEVDRAISDATPHPLNVANGRVPEAISRVVLKAMAKNPAERYQSGAQLMTALESAMREPRIASAGKPATGKFSVGDSTGSFRPNATGAFNPNATGSFRRDATGSFSPNATGSFNGNATGSFNANATGSFSRDASNAATRSSTPPASPTTRARVPNPPTKAVRRKSVGSSNKWIMVAGVVAVLVILAAFAMLLQRKPADLTSDSETSQSAAPSASASASAAAPFSTPAAAPADTSVTATAAPAAEEPSATASHFWSRASKRSRSARNYVQPAPAAPAQGQLEVSAFPLGAVIQIEGLEGQWKSPQLIGPIPAGTYKVTVSSPGYASQMRSIQVASGGRATVNVSLAANKGFVKVTGSPAGASVFLDGKDTGKVTPADLMVDPGAHSITVRKAGYLESSTDLKLAAGQGSTYSPRLMVAGRTDNIRIVGGGMGRMFGGGGSANGMARIEIKSEPKGAQVIVNGTPLQKATPVEIQVDAGSYDITLQKDGYKPVHESAIVGMDDHVKIDRELTR